jgi:hypothetical protein
MDPAAAGAYDNPVLQYVSWPDSGRKGNICCMLCGQKVKAGVGRLVRHLAGGSSDVKECPVSTTEIKKEMRSYLDGRKFKAIERVIDAEDAAEVQRRRSIVYTI